jgi:hypothetical protein
MTRQELTVVLQAVLMSSYTRRSEALWTINRELRLKDLSEDKDAEKKDYVSKDQLPS